MLSYARTAFYLCLLAAAMAAFFFDVARPWDLKLLDAQFRLLRARGPAPVSPDVLIVGIDEDTVSALPEPLTLWHKHLGQFMHAMVMARPAAVGIDIILPDRSYESVATGFDSALLRGLLEARRSYPLVMARTVDPSGRPRAIHRPFIAAAGEGATGYALFPLDTDGVARRFDERLGMSAEPIPTLAGQIARRLGVEPHAGIIDFSRGAEFNYIPLRRVLDWADAGQREQLEQTFGGKVVLLGTVLPFTDRVRLPVHLEAWNGESDTAGVLLHAQTLRSLLGGHLIRVVPQAMVMALTAAATLLWFVNGGMIVLAGVMLTVVAVLLIGAVLLLSHGWHLPVTVPLLAGVCAHGGRHIYETALKLLERRRLRGVFSGYVSPDVMREIIAGKLHPKLGGESKHVCVLFSDIRGYTTRSEGMTPQAIVEFLNRYFEDAVSLIHAEGGTVVCFMGDGIMVVFGAPNALDNPCLPAFRAACAILEHVAHFNAGCHERGEAPIAVGIGLHAGEAVIGHVGASARHDYTAIGDVTNVASRLEGLTKEAGYRLVVSKYVAQQLPADTALTELGPMAIKGHTPVEVYGYDRIKAGS